MSWQLVFENLLQPPVLFFGLGVAAILVKAGVELPSALGRALSLYLLIAIGFEGGVKLRAGGWDANVASALGAAILMSVLVPVVTFFVARRFLSVPNAAAVAATYGSVSVVTFIAARSFLETMQIPSGGHMVAAMALMEAPAIVVGVALARQFDRGAHGSWGEVLKDAFLNGSVFVLVGAFIIGILTGKDGLEAIQPFTGDIFKGVLCVFLLYMGLTAASKFGELKGVGAFPIVWAIVGPLIWACVGLLMARAFGLPQGDAFLLVVLSASASYIAVPAAMQLAVPRANPGLYVTMSLALTFPFNIGFGLPLYMSLVRWATG